MHINRTGLVVGAVVAIASMAGMAVAPTRALASSIAVVNPSFELGPSGNPLPVNGLPITDGTCNPSTSCSWSNGPIFGWNGGGQFQPGATAFNSVPDGITVAWSNGGAITQTVGATAVPGTTYTLNVDVGFRYDLRAYGPNFPTVSLIVGGNTVNATGITNLFSGNWYDWTATYVATAGDAGAPITIDLFSPGIQGDFDKVSLTATPLPSTWTMLIAGLLGLVFFTYRRTRPRPVAALSA
jgi:hypothetical protein